MRKFLAAAVLMLLPAAAFTAGGVGCDYLRVEPPARTAAMSNAFAGVADDLSSILYNPAGLVNIQNVCFSLTHYSSFADTNYEYVSFAIPVDAKFGTAGGSVLMDYTFDFHHYDEFGDNIGEVDNYDFVATASYGYPVTQGIAVGANLKFFYSKLLSYEKTGVAFDAGAFFSLGKDPDTYAGIVIQNVGAQSAYIDIVDPMPMNIKAGVGVGFGLFNKTRMLVAADVNRLLIPGQEIPTLDLGAEIELFHSICIRGGYGFRHDLVNMSIGIGFNLEKVRFSYAYQPFDVLGVVHRISLDIELKEDEKNNTPLKYGEK